MANEKKVKFDGELVQLGDREFIVPSLSMKQAKDLWPEILDMDQGITKVNLPEKQSKWLDIVTAAISRNYPDVRREELEELVDLRSIRKLMLIVMGNSGLEPVPPAEPGAERKHLVQ